VNFVLSHDRTGRFLFAPLQGETAAVWLSSEDVTRLHSLVRVAEGRVYRKSAAVVRILCRLSLPWAMAGCLLWLIPGPLRDAGYDLVARYRYRIFGKHETCRLPTTADRARFLE
jgi:predicted DCC family thiol-disulfide oxidoreductase YuxK